MDGRDEDGCFRDGILDSAYFAGTVFWYAWLRRLGCFSAVLHRQVRYGDPSAAYLSSRYPVSQPPFADFHVQVRDRLETGPEVLPCGQRKALCAFFFLASGTRQANECTRLPPGQVWNLSEVVLGFVLWRHSDGCSSGSCVRRCQPGRLDLMERGPLFAGKIWIPRSRENGIHGCRDLFFACMSGTTQFPSFRFAHQLVRFWRPFCCAPLVGCAASSCELAGT